jgi:glycerophosphoryl diester phosphodiesterase
MQNGVAFRASKKIVRLKWHCLRRRFSDPPFNASRLAEGLAIGASLEVDLRLHADNGFAILHDATLERETDGAGPVRCATPEQLRALVMRRSDGGRPERPMLLEDLASIASSIARPPALLQFDLKDPAAAICPEAIDSFRAAVTPFMDICILSGDDWRAVQLLASSNPDLELGFDVAESVFGTRPGEPQEFMDLVSRALKSAPTAGWFYLHHSTISDARRCGVDVVDLLHRHGKQVDAWTVNPTDPDAREILRELIAANVDQITTDDPMVMQQMADALVRPEA